MANEIILEPNYAVLRERFSREAKLQADTILADLISEHLIAPEHIKLVQARVLRVFQSVLVPINICIQATDNNQAVLECRELVDGVTKSIIAKADEIEKVIADQFAGDDQCSTCGRRGRKIFQMEDGKPMCFECADWAAGKKR